MMAPPAACRALGGLQPRPLAVAKKAWYTLQQSWSCRWAQDSGIVKEGNLMASYYGTEVITPPSEPACGLLLLWPAGRGCRRSQDRSLPLQCKSFWIA